MAPRGPRIPWRINLWLASAVCVVSTTAECTDVLLANSAALLNVTFNTSIDMTSKYGVVAPDFVQVIPSAYHQLQAAVAYAHVDVREAVKRVSSVLSYQNTDGSMPHLIYNVYGLPSAVASGIDTLGYRVRNASGLRVASESVFPACDFWTTHDPSVCTTSTLIAPPYHASAVLQVFYALYNETSSDAALQFLSQSWPALYQWHKFLFTSQLLTTTASDRKDVSAWSLYPLVSPLESGRPQQRLHERVSATNSIGNAKHKFNKCFHSHFGRGVRLLAGRHTRYSSLGCVLAGPGRVCRALVRVKMRRRVQQKYYLYELRLRD
jgi:hypothetical protein